MPRTRIPATPEFVNRVRALLAYDAETGILTWRISRCRNSIKAGDTAGCLRETGYVFIGIDGKQYLAHRIIFLIVTGKWPDNLVDHRDKVRSNNAWGNIRPATDAQNQQNTSISSNNTSGYRGVSFDTKYGKYRAEIYINGKRTYLGRYFDPKDANLAYKTAAKQHFGEFYSD
jgi:hypothetical protein